MAHAEQARRDLPHATTVITAIAVAAIIVAVTLALDPFTLPRGEVPAGANQPNPAVLEAEREWAALRHLLSGYVDPQIEAGREWQRQREQQSPYDDR